MQLKTVGEHVLSHSRPCPGDLQKELFLAFFGYTNRLLISLVFVRMWQLNRMSAPTWAEQIDEPQVRHPSPSAVCRRWMAS
jgi:hypothetical protein